VVAHEEGDVRHQLLGEAHPTEEPGRDPGAELRVAVEATLPGALRLRLARVVEEQCQRQHEVRGLLAVLQRLERVLPHVALGVVVLRVRDRTHGCQLGPGRGDEPGPLEEGEPLVGPACREERDEQVALVGQRRQLTAGRPAVRALGGVMVPRGQAGGLAEPHPGRLAVGHPGESLCAQVRIDAGSVQERAAGGVVEQAHHRERHVERRGEAVNAPEDDPVPLAAGHGVLQRQSGVLEVVEGPGQLPDRRVGGEVQWPRLPDPEIPVQRRVAAQHVGDVLGGESLEGAGHGGASRTIYYRKADGARRPGREAARPAFSFGRA